MTAQADNPMVLLSGEEQANLVDVSFATGSFASATAISAFMLPLADVSMTPATFSYLSTPGVQRRSVAERFARIARNLRGVEEVWLTSTLPELEVSIVMRDVDFDTELELRGIFIDLVCEALDPSVGELSVYAESEDVPDAVRGGLQLA